MASFFTRDNLFTAAGCALLVGSTYLYSNRLRRNNTAALICMLDENFTMNRYQPHSRFKKIHDYLSSNELYCVLVEPPFDSVRKYQGMSIDEYIEEARKRRAENKK